ncbi:TetR/AcrR family transcriptional regulator [Treponema putidum]|uniref:TetR/AcrR family transcriptional regulator n=1 Tax=Treponema putidum TaxID=221027 RepID=UPI0006792F40|nr:TetR/AcrR family transcriptional regulator [Treponema putidum]TWI77785.1 TetR family transcriptional regulator [Treponema putidum]
MPKKTFLNLPQEKQQRILETCKKEFEKKPIFQASVSDIVNTLGIARGSFYQYFENLEECFFTILSSENMDVHALFQESLQENDNDFFNALLRYAGILSKELYKKSKRNLYKNRFLYWTPNLDKAWSEYRKKYLQTEKVADMEKVYFSNLEKNSLSVSTNEDIKELIEFTKAIVHNLISRSFIENWGPKNFIEHFEKQILWMKNGLKDRE